MKFPAYSRYKPSGVEWLGDVPEHWELKKLKFVTKTITGGVWGEDPDAENQGVPVATTANIGRQGELDVNGMNRRVLSLEERQKGKCAPGDTIVVKSSGSATNVISGKAGYVKPEHGELFFSNFTMRVRPRMQEAHPKFAWYFLISEIVQSQVRLMVSTTTYPNLQVPEYLSCLYPKAPLLEQRAIADFLDARTAKLDTLVAKKRALIERLKEKRTALISHTVTRGLPPDAARPAGLDPRPKLKASGIEWLGNVPEHWKVKPMKFISRIGNGSTPNRENVDYWWDGTYPWLNSSVVKEEEVSEASDFVTALALRECHLPKIVPPAVLVGITGQGKTRGMATILTIEATTNQHLAYLKPLSSDLDVRYLRRTLDHAYRYLRSESEGGGSTKGAITCEQLANLTLAIPPPSEQRAIADYLDQEAAKIDQMVAKVEAAIERLQEYRTALITAAVTGKIDVRGLATAAGQPRPQTIAEPDRQNIPNTV